MNAGELLEERDKHCDEEEAEVKNLLHKMCVYVSGLYLDVHNECKIPVHTCIHSISGQFHGERQIKRHILIYIHVATWESYPYTIE